MKKYSKDIAELLLGSVLMLFWWLLTNGFEEVIR